MKKTILVVGLLAAVLMCVFAASAFGPKSASKQQLVGTWTLVSDDHLNPDGSRTGDYGANPAGILMFDDGGRYAIQIVQTGRAKFAANDRKKGTPEEYKATVEGTNPHWGTYDVDDGEQVIVFNIDHASYPNWEGTTQRRKFTIDGDRLKYVVTSLSTGTAPLEVVWQRAK
ncbi:MAG TPA: lipocalin-like domain-containing protein [Terriglobales bacterium]|jgi:hypothetical protein|nr:lipocalin-like domain-containing protein [Terriglobales bacterium]